MELEVGNTIIKLQQGDITEVTADAIVNAANNHLWMGGGVAGAIKRKGGKIIEEEATRQGPIPIGEAVATSAGKLNAKYVIHAAGMGTDLRTDEEKIASATLNSLKRAEELKLASIAFPSIGTGVGGFPITHAAEIMLKTSIKHLKGSTSLKKIIFVLYGNKAYNAFEKVLTKLKDQ
ncbi:MAG: macro domain-containing protein [Thermoplasmata archaeon]|nr:MAG: macro domain-containing protein [Thermoplasmata archaeon]